MSLYVFDTDHLSLFQMGHPRVLQNVLLHLHDQLAISVISIEEQLSGWQRLLRQARDDLRREEVYRRMANAVADLAHWRIVDFPLVALQEHAHLLQRPSSNAQPARLWARSWSGRRGLVGMTSARRT